MSTESKIQEIVNMFINSPEKSVPITLYGVTNSMLPSIKPGEYVTIKKADFVKLEVGDVVVFSSGNNLVAHRLVCLKNFIAITKGDNNSDCDHPISVFDIIGVIEGKSSKKALWYYFFRNKLRKMPILRKSYLVLKSLLK